MKPMKFEKFIKELEEQYGGIQTIENIMRTANEIDAKNEAEDILKNRERIKTSGETGVYIRNINDLEHVLAILYYLYKMAPFDVLKYEVIWGDTNEQ